MGIINLFIFMMMDTLGGRILNGPTSDGILYLGWFGVGQVCLLYLSVVIVKCFYLPRLEQELKNNKS